MKKIGSILFIVALGILLSATQLSSKTDDVITLTEDNHIVFSGPVNVTLSTCPIVNGILDVEFAKENFRSAQEATNLVKMAKRSVMWNF